jgi:DNA excision repair protein ERCC-6
VVLSRKKFCPKLTVPIWEHWSLPWQKQRRLYILNFYVVFRIFSLNFDTRGIWLPKMPRRRRVLTLQEAIEEVGDLGNDEDGASIEHTQLVLLPPDQVDALSDEERIDDDDLEAAVPTDVAGQVEIENIDQEDEDEDDIPLARFVQGGQWRKTQKLNKVPAKCLPEPLIEVHPDLLDLSPVQLFFKFFNNSVMELLITESTRYAKSKNKHDFDIGEDDLCAFIGILLLTGYHSLPNEKLYWSKAEDVAVPLAAGRMPRNRFMEIKRFMHCADNANLDPSNKMAKIQPLMDLLNKNLQQFGIFSRYLSIDESMVPYFGHHSAKMFIRGKPIRFGYKVWSLCTDDGYPLKLVPYTGADPANTHKGPLGTRVVMNLIDIVVENREIEVYFDNFFTNVDLLVQLAELGICVLTDSIITWSAPNKADANFAERTPE